MGELHWDLYLSHSLLRHFDRQGYQESVPWLQLSSHLDVREGEAFQVVLVHQGQTCLVWPLQTTVIDNLKTKNCVFSRLDLDCLAQICLQHSDLVLHILELALFLFLMLLRQLNVLEDFK